MHLRRPRVSGLMARASGLSGLRGLGVPRAERHVGCAAASNSLVACSAVSALKEAPRMGANAVFCTSGRKPRCSALTRRLVKRVALGLSDSASGCDIGVPTSVTVFSRSGAGPEARLALTLLRIGFAIDRSPDRARSREIGDDSGGSRKENLFREVVCDQGDQGRPDAA